jgi:hypothetical protein
MENFGALHGHLVDILLFGICIWYFVTILAHVSPNYGFLRQ